MKKLLPLILVVLAAAIVWALVIGGKSGTTATSTPDQAPTSSLSNNSQATPNSGSDASNPTNPIAKNNTGSGEGEIEEDQGADTKPAAEVYSSADDAMKAVLEGSKDYNDIILEQFTQPGDDCTWCPDFYQQVRDKISATDATQDQKSYLAEILAISGREENVKTLVDKVKNASTPQEGELFAEALELTVGNDDITKFLGDQMSSTNDTLREASVAAITNQGSRLAAELLSKHVVERGDPDGYYSIGIGPGEFIPDEEALPYVQDLVAKRDKYSHLWVKSLINSGLNGLRLVFDELETSKDPEADRALLKDALDHVPFEDGLEEYLAEKTKTSKQPLVVDFANQILEEFKNQGEDTSESDQAETQSPTAP